MGAPARRIERRRDGSLVLWERPGLGVMVTPVGGRLIVCLADGPHPFNAVAVTLVDEQLEELQAAVAMALAAPAS